MEKSPNETVIGKIVLVGAIMGSMTDQSIPRLANDICAKASVLAYSGSRW